MKNDAIDRLIFALECLIDDMEFRRNPYGTWSGCENMEDVREHVRRALIECLKDRDVADH